MRKIIFKYHLNYLTTEHIVPAPSRILKVGVQRGEPWVWIEHPFDSPTSLFELHVFTFQPTGKAFDLIASGKYLDTLLFEADSLVFHVYHHIGKIK